MKLPPRSAILAELCRRDFFFFVKEFWSTIIEETPVYNWHIEYLCKELQRIAHRVKDKQPKEYDLIINIPPGTSKSTICTIMYPVWCWVVDPSMRFITGSYSSDLSTGHAVKSRDIIRSDKFQQYFPYIELKPDKDNKTDYENTRKGARTATSVGGTATGKHAHIIIVDDPLNPKKAASETERQNATSWMDGTLSTRKVDKEITPTILIMQRLHDLDCTGHILKKENKKVKHICLPGELSANVQPPELKEKYVDGLLDPARLSKDVLKELRVDLGSYGYAGQIQQRPSPDEGGIIKKHWFNTIGYDEFLKIDNNPTFDIFIDSAYTGDTRNDPTALLCASFINNNLYIKESIQVWLEFPELIREIKSFAALNLSRRIFIEPKASGKSIVQQLRKESNLNIIELDSPKDDKTTRLNAVSPFIEARRVFIISGKWNDNFLSECASFPNGQHDDQVDNLTNAIDRYSLSKKGRRAVA